MTQTSAASAPHPPPSDGTDPHTSTMVLTYAVSMVAGFLLVSSVVSALRGRAA